MLAIINTPICPLKSAPEIQAQTPSRSCLEDEVLLGMPVETTDAEQDGWVPVRTHYGYTGYVPANALVTGAAAAAWQGLPQQVILHKHCADVLAEPRVQGAFVESALPMGARVAVNGTPDENGWQAVTLPDGRCGYLCVSFLGQLWQQPCAQDPKTLRRALTDTARLYLGTQYRWGGKTPAGIDCSGLCSMAYMLCGILIYRDAAIQEGFPIHRIPISEMREGDLVYFPGHIAMYLGEGLYIHSTGRQGDNGVTINSFDPHSPLYRADLPQKITAVGSWFSKPALPQE